MVQPPLSLVATFFSCLVWFTVLTRRENRVQPLLSSLWEKIPVRVSERLHQGSHLQLNRRQEGFECIGYPLKHRAVCGRAVFFFVKTISLALNRMHTCRQEKSSFLHTGKTRTKYQVAFTKCFFFSCSRIHTETLFYLLLRILPINCVPPQESQKNKRGLTFSCVEANAHLTLSVVLILVLCSSAAEPRPPLFSKMFTIGASLVFL